MTTAVIDRNAVSAGDTIMWRTRNGGHEASGVAQWATRDAVHVEVPGRGIYAVEWDRVETVTAPARCYACGRRGQLIRDRGRRYCEPCLFGDMDREAAEIVADSPVTVKAR